MGSQVQHRVGAAQNKPEDITAREFNGQQSSTPRKSCPKQTGKYHRGRSNWAAKVSTAAKLAAQTKSENITEGKEATHSPHSKWRRKLFYEECNTKNISVNAGYINDSCK
ncbi:MAG: hypothetical protein PUD21_04200 [Clostridiaceae bacterium]|nr:hypothetical protein [Clostridiaceae bacterium]